MTQILIINGSPRLKGNSAYISKLLKQGFDEANFTSKILVLDKLSINPCKACDSCIRSGNLKCIQKDDMLPLYSDIQDSSCIIFVSPIYWFSVSAQTKLFMDRLYAFHTKEGFKLSEKIMAGILVYGDEDVVQSGGINAVRSMQDTFSYCKARFKKIIFGTAMDPEDVKQNYQFIDRVGKFNEELIAEIKSSS
ncbi:flavodoxin family protein [Candidatus Lokiarchaeum ossiferum]|uniref:flavodoxin family protein n=1 Tax=Candidatus Lokiarchaeum ossiferum TaxID=2951803 RepID=UPI00352CD5C7